MTERKWEKRRKEEERGGKRKGMVNDLSFILCSTAGLLLSSSYSHQHLSKGAPAAEAVAKLVACCAGMFPDTDRFTFEWNQLRFVCVMLQTEAASALYCILFHALTTCTVACQAELQDDEQYLMQMDWKHLYLQHAVFSLFSMRQLDNIVARCSEVSSCDNSTFADTISERAGGGEGEGGRGGGGGGGGGGGRGRGAPDILSTTMRDRLKQFEDHIVRVVLGMV